MKLEDNPLSELVKFSELLNVEFWDCDVDVETEDGYMVITAFANGRVAKVKMSLDEAREVVAKAKRSLDETA